MREITVVGGGLAGLVAAVEAAEAGARVTVHEAHTRLGGRGRAAPGPYRAYEGVHALYSDDPSWRWLADRDLVRAAPLPMRALWRIGFRSGGRFTRRPPQGLLRMVAHRRRPAPVDRCFHDWAAEVYGERAARAAANAVGVATYDADTGRLSAAFVWNLLHRVFAPRPPAVRYPAGGWESVIARTAARARGLGARIETGSRITGLPEGPVVVATELSSARVLLGDDTLRWDSGAVALLDLAVRTDRRDPFAVFDLDEGGFCACPSLPDPSLAPRGESLFQLQMPIRSGESHGRAHARLEEFADTVIAGRRDRTTWTRTAVARGRSGALDRPGLTWRERPAIDRGGEVFLAGDMVAAPGMRGEVSVNSAIRAARGACARPTARV